MPKIPDRHVIVSDDYDSKIFMKARKSLKCSEVLVFQAIVGQTIKEYSRRMGDAYLEKINVVSVF